MEEKILKGTISFVSYEKNFATIEYLKGASKKSVNCKTGIEATGRKTQHFRIGDTVSFEMRLSDRGDKMTAFNIKFLHNEKLDLLIQKANIENRFAGYLKKVDDNYFVKEFDSYIFFPIQLSPWEKPPVETAENVAISFRLLNLERPNAIVAELFSHNFSPAYKKAMQHFKNEIEAEGLVTRISPHAIYIDLFDGGIQAKLPLQNEEEPKAAVGDKLSVMITFLSNIKIAVKRLSASSFEKDPE